MLEFVERHSTGKARLLRVIEEVAASGWCERSYYFTRASLEARADDARVIIPPRAGEEALDIVLRATGESDTGAILFMGERKAVAICPAFPVKADAAYPMMEPSPLIDLLHTEYVIGIVLLRLGRYAVGVLRGDYLVASKTAARYMKNRHRAGGQSQRRFERSRERLIRELYDKTCETARTVFAPYEKGMDYLLFGGERSTLLGFTERCPLVQKIGDKALKRRLAIDQPNQKTLENIAFEAWKSRVLTFQSV